MIRFGERGFFDTANRRQACGLNLWIGPAAQQSSQYQAITYTGMSISSDGSEKNTVKAKCLCQLYEYFVYFNNYI